ncbi:MAG: hypothetical protein OXN96_19245 [Bryobacterales bacterium]|nr:hypothetical protein [Bryobacterales bacterium]
MEPVRPSPLAGPFETALSPASSCTDTSRITPGDVRDLIELADNLAAWSETVDGPLDYGDFEDLEELGRRAHEIVQRLRPRGPAGDSRISERELDAALGELDRHAV